MPNIADAFAMIGQIFTTYGKPNMTGLSGATFIMLASALVLLVFKDLRDEYYKKRMVFLDLKPIRWAIYVLLFCMILNFGVLDGGQFIYVNF